MKNNTKSSITLPATELKIVEELMRSLKVTSKVEIIRKGLALLKESHDRQQLRAAYQNASIKVREITLNELDSLDHLTDEGID